MPTLCHINSYTQAIKDIDILTLAYKVFIIT